MKTKFYYLLLAAAMTLGASTFVSCGDDDDAPEINNENPADANKGNLSIAGFKTDIKYCNMMAMFQDSDEPIVDELGKEWPIFDSKGNQLAWCEIRFSSWDMTQNWNVPDGQSVSYLQLSFMGYADTNGEYISGEYTCVGGTGCINQNQQTWESDVEFDFEPATIKVVRGKDGIYTVTLPMKGNYTLDSNWENTKEYNSTFKYVGEMVNMRHW